LNPSNPQKCPRCGGDAYRIRRRLIDRLLSLIVPLGRYSCESFVCNWEGNLVVRSSRKNGPTLSGVRSEPVVGHIENEVLGSRNLVLGSRNLDENSDDAMTSG
jgi:hypothetical protein